MKEVEITVTNPSGLHARPATELVKLANRFHSDINIVKENKTINAKSIVGVLSLGINRGATITLTADGADEDKALQALKELFDNNFGEEV